MSDQESAGFNAVQEPQLQPAASQGLVTPPRGPLAVLHRIGTPAYRRNIAGQLVRFVVPPVIVFILLVLGWEYIVRWRNVPTYVLPPPSKIIDTLRATGDLLKQYAWYTAIDEALPGFLLGSGLGFLVAVVAMRFRFLARGLIPYAIISNSIPIIGLAPIAVNLFGDDWQGKAVIVAVLTFFPMLIGAYRGLTSIDSLSLQLMRSYAASGWKTFYKLRLPASLPYVFNALKINTTLAMIGAIVSEYFAGRTEGLGYYINDQSSKSHMSEVWSAVVMACAIGISVYLVMVTVERFFTSWHISYRAGR